MGSVEGQEIYLISCLMSFLPYECGDSVSNNSNWDHFNSMEFFVFNIFFFQIFKKFSSFLCWHFSEISWITEIELKHVYKIWGPYSAQKLELSSWNKIAMVKNCFLDREISIWQQLYSFFFPNMLTFEFWYAQAIINRNNVELSKTQ